MFLKFLMAACCAGCVWFTWKVIKLWRTQEPNAEPLTPWEIAFAVLLLVGPPAGAVTFAVLFFKRFV